MRLTLLSAVQSVLGALDSDSVNTIGATMESEQIALLAQEEYYRLCTYETIPDLRRLAQLQGMNDLQQATVMQIPDGATDIADVRYKCTDGNGFSRMERMVYVETDEFLDTQLDLRVGEPGIDENVLSGNIRIPYHTDRSPRCYTIFDNETLVFDAVDRVVQQDSTLHNNNSLCMAYIITPFEQRDDFIPDMPDIMFPQWLDRIKEVAFNEQKQIDSPIHRRNGEREGHRNRNFASIRDGLNQGEARRGFGRQSKGPYFRARTGSGIPRIRG